MMSRQQLKYQLSWWQYIFGPNILQAWESYKLVANPFDGVACNPPPEDPVISTSHAANFPCWDMGRGRDVHPFSRRPPTHPRLVAISIDNHPVANDV